MCADVTAHKQDDLFSNFDCNTTPAAFSASELLISDEDNALASARLSNADHVQPLPPQDAPAAGDKLGDKTAPDLP